MNVTKAAIASWGGQFIEERQLAAAANNFNAVRLVLASGVIWTHCYWILTGITARDEISDLVGLPVSHFAVNGFFFVSGFLVCQSLFRQPGVIRFAAMRFGRIWPGLTVCLFLTVAVFALLSDRPLAYATDWETLQFLARNLTQMKAYYTLPPLQAGGELLTVNGSLWTIPWELRCYVALALFYGLAASLRGRALAIVSIASMALCGGWLLARDFAPAFPDVTKGLAYNINIWARLWGCFSTGVAASIWWRRIFILPWALLPIWLAAIAEYQLAGTAFVGSLAIFYTVLVAAFAQRDERAATAGWHDFSYGIYIYAYPVMVVVNLIWSTRSHEMLALATFAATLPIAALSWFLVEKPALAATKRFMKRKPAPLASRSAAV